jgi:hypothetical protein
MGFSQIVRVFEPKLGIECISEGDRFDKWLTTNPDGCEPLFKATTISYCSKQLLASD